MDEGTGFPARRDSFHFKSAANPAFLKSVQNFTLDSELRVTRWPLCASYYTSL